MRKFLGSALKKLGGWLLDAAARKAAKKLEENSRKESLRLAALEDWLR
jgi:hypothetical protein